MIRIYGYDIEENNCKIKRVRYYQNLSKKQFEAYKQKIRKKIIKYNEEGKIIKSPWFIFKEL